MPPPPQALRSLMLAKLMEAEYRVELFGLLCQPESELAGAVFEPVCDLRWIHLDQEDSLPFSYQSLSLSQLKFFYHVSRHVAPAIAR